MRIAVNASVYDHRPSGLGIYARELCTALRGLHDDLVAYTSRTDDLRWGRSISPLGEPMLGWRGHLWRLAWTQTALPLRVRLDRADVLVNTVPEGPLLPRRPQVTVVHDMLPLFFPADFPRQQFYFHAFVPAVLRASAAIVADSGQTAEDVAHHYGIPRGRITIVPPGVDFAQFHPYPNPGAIAARFDLGPYVLFVGNVRPHKNLGRLIDAFARLRGGVSLAVVGHRDRRYWPPLARQIDRLGLADRVRVLDYVPAETLPALYSGARAVVIPSLYEGFGLPILEAMACGAPVIASTTGGLREAAGDAALLVDPEDEPAIAVALQRLVDDAALRDDLRRRGTAHAARFTWEATARGVRAVIERVLATRP